MADGVELEPLLVEHRDGSVHIEHGVTTLDDAGVPARGPGAPGESGGSGGHAGRWDYEAPAMRAWCGCGWTGREHPQARPSVAGAAAGTRRVEWDRANRSTMRAAGEEWATHVHEVLPTLRVLVAMAGVRAAEAALTAAVVDARKAGASWAGVADATGATRQSAHERWRDIDPLTASQRSRGGRRKGAGTVNPS